ncbi:hypothetical protein R8Z50_10710 [Longispora sp. K20-0274]|uniref:hypothetical protein n=1 Tax=Longispora sp. K20-0274 TaxID=3088255 RepID=UPI00399B2211
MDEVPRRADHLLRARQRAPGTVEGATLDVKNIINFDEIVHESGANVYVKLN